MEEEAGESPSILDAAEAMEPESEKTETVDAAEEATVEAQEEQPSEDSEASTDYESMTVAELKELLKTAGKPVSGKKAYLIARCKSNFVNGRVRNGPNWDNRWHWAHRLSKALKVIGRHRNRSN